MKNETRTEVKIDGSYYYEYERPIGDFSINLVNIIMKSVDCVAWNGSTINPTVFAYTKIIKYDDHMFITIAGKYQHIALLSTKHEYNTDEHGEEVCIDGKYYYMELTYSNHQYDKDSVAYAWNSDITKYVSCKLWGYSKNVYMSNHFMTSQGSFAHAVLLSSEHKKKAIKTDITKKSRRATNIELMEWLAKGNGYYIGTNGYCQMGIVMNIDYIHCPCDKNTQLYNWNGEPIECTAKAMGFNE